LGPEAQWAIDPRLGAKRSTLFQLLSSSYTIRYASLWLFITFDQSLTRSSGLSMPALIEHMNGKKDHGSLKSSSSSSIPTLVRVDPHTPGNQQPNIHTRWHPDIP
jgi:hypothetical protein